MEKLNIKYELQVDENLIAEYIKDYHASPRAKKILNDLGISDEIAEKNIVKIHDFILDVNYCSSCPGFDNCAKESPHLCSKISYEDNYVSRSLVPCKKYLEDVKFKQQFIISDFDESWMRNSLKDIDKTRTRKEAFDKFNAFNKNESTSWIYLCGCGGTGRSFLASIFAIEAVKKGKGPVCFINSSLRTKELNDLSYKKNDEFQKKLDSYASCPILVIDDFGNEVKNDFVRDGIIFQILSKRANKRLFTIITSDFMISDIVELYSTNKAGAIRAQQIGKILSSACGKEINLGEISLY